MKLLLLFALLAAAAYAHGDCGGDCLHACRNCPALENDGPEPEDGKTPFCYGSKYPGDCKAAICKDKDSVMIIDGSSYPNVVCFQGKWHFGYPNFLEATDSAQCRSPGNLTCDKDVEIMQFEEEFKCVCKPGYVDLSEEFESETPLCTNCGNKKLNIILLVDSSGSMDKVMLAVQKFIAQLVKFLQPSDESIHIALMTSAFSYDIKVNWGDAASKDGSLLTPFIAAIVADGQSYLGSGMEAVKAALVQPEHPDNEGQEYKLVVFTDGSVKHAPPAIRDITVAANNLDALKVETFVVATNVDERFAEAQKAIVNDYDNNVFAIENDEDNLEIVYKLQKRICV